MDKTLKDYQPTKPQARDFYVPREPMNSGGMAAPRHPGVGEVRGTQSSMGPKAVASGVGSGMTGAFCRQYIDAGGDTYLQGGTIAGSNGGSEVIADYKTLDVADTPPLADSGDRLYLSCNVTATLANGVVQPGVTLNSATLTKVLPTAHTFSTAALTGVVFREIGRWTDTEFLPSGACGISTVSGCPGSFAIV